MGDSKMQRKRKKLDDEEKLFAEEIERSMELAMEEDGRKVQELETEKADERVWLMKCPPKVNKAWRELSASSSSSESVIVAKYSESVDLLLPDLSPELNMEMVFPELWNISKLYSVNKSKDFVGPVLNIFSEANQGQVALEGTVTHKLDVRPHCGIEDYGKLLRKGNMKPVAENRQIQVVDDFRGEHLMPKPALVTKVKRCERRTRSDRRKVEAKTFELFERQSKWTVRQLVQETNQPELFVRELLKELCVYNGRSGFTYELKPEYKITGKEGTTGAQ